MVLCSRSLAQGGNSSVALLPWAELASWKDYPFVICGSHAPCYLIKKAAQDPSTELIVDLSLPRIVDPEVSSQLKLLCMEEVIALIETRQQRNENEIERAKNLLLVSVQRHIRAFIHKQRRAVPCLS